MTFNSPLDVILEATSAQLITCLVAGTVFAGRLISLRERFDDMLVRREAARVVREQLAGRDVDPARVELA